MASGEDVHAAVDASPCGPLPWRERPSAHREPGLGLWAGVLSALGACLLVLAVSMMSGCAEMQVIRLPLPSLVDDEVAVTFVGHATTLIRIDGSNILTDPELNDHVSIIRRSRGASVAPEDLPRLDAILVSHPHRDHLDQWTMEQLPRDIPVLISRGNGEILRGWGFTDVREMDPWDECRLGAVSIVATPARHSGARNSGFVGTPRALGFLVQGRRRTIYFAGDTGLFEGFTDIGRRAHIDLALLPIGAYRPRWFMKDHHMSPADALQAMTMLRAKEMVPIHWGSFRMASDALDEPKEVLLELVAGGDLERRVHVLENGATVVLAAGETPARTLAGSRR